ncbi:MAG: TatD family hydrolase [Crocosphaera sp.]|nr:TatD family hydrolase [Crocosphaera sp.]
MQLIDTHVHINFDVFESDLEDIQNRWQQAEVVHLVHSCVEPEEFASIQGLANRLGNLSFAVGLHPLDADKWTKQTAREIYDYAISDERVVAIGEMGLDFYKADNQEQQHKVLEEQLKIAHQLQKPVIIHCRDAAESLKASLEQFWQTTGPVTGVMHCWGGTPEETKWFLDLGFYISFSGVVTFKNAKTIQDSAKIVPDERLLVETDCPFLAPVPKRGKRNEPANVRHVAEFLAKLRNVPLETLAQQTTQNACQLFNLRLGEKQ